MNTIGDPSLTLGLSIDTTTADSSSTIVPNPLPSAIVAFVAPLRPTVYVSFPSANASFTIPTLTVCVVTPGANVSVPLVAP